ncbi:hypothetical protein [Nostoc sp.]
MVKFTVDWMNKFSDWALGIGHWAWGMGQKLSKTLISWRPLRRQSLQREATAVDGNACIKEPARWAALPTCSDWRQVAWEPPQRAASPLRFVFS